MSRTQDGGFIQVERERAGSRRGLRATSRGLVASRTRSGQVLLLFLLFFGFICSVLGLMLDGGRLYFEKRRVQMAADAGVIAAVHELRRNHRSQAYLDAAAQADAALHKFQASEVTVYWPPITGDNVGNDNYAEVVVARLVPTTFMRMFGPDVSTVRGRAVAGLKRVGDPCIYALNRTASNAMWVNGNARIEADCGFQVNSDASDALSENGTGCLIGTSVAVVGGVDPNSDCINPTPITNTAPASDPLATMAEPNCSTMTSRNPSSFYDITRDGETYRVYLPGRYNNRINIANRNVFFMPGIYCLESGMQTEGGHIVGADVMFYNKGGASGSGNIRIAGNTEVQLWGRTSSEYHGMLFFASREDLDAAPGNQLGRGTEDSFYSGTLYFPTQSLTWAGNPDGTSAWTLIVADTLQIAGNASQTITINQPTEDQAPPIWAAMFFE